MADCRWHDRCCFPSWFSWGRWSPRHMDPNRVVIVAWLYYIVGNWLSLIYSVCARMTVFSGLQSMFPEFQNIVGFCLPFRFFVFVHPHLMCSGFLAAGTTWRLLNARFAVFAHFVRLSIVSGEISESGLLYMWLGRIGVWPDGRIWLCVHSSPVDVHGRRCCLLFVIIILPRLLSALNRFIFCTFSAI